MARGSHHGGSTHRGSYHSSSSSSHSSHSLSHSSSSGSHKSGSSSYGPYDESKTRRARLLIFGLAFLVVILDIIVCIVNGFKMVYSVSIALSAIGIAMCLNETYYPIGMREGVEILKNGPSNRVHYFYNYRESRKTLPKSQHVIVADNKSWCSEKYYYFYFKDDEEVTRKVSYFIAAQPRIIFVEPVFALFWAIGLFIVGFFSYDFIIPLFENMTMSDEAFKVVDALVYLFPFLLVFACGMACQLSNYIFHKRMRTFCEGVLKERKAKRAIELQMARINERQDSTWYYNTCPSCGVVCDDKATACSNCGVSLRITDKDFDVAGAHQVKNIETVSEAKEIED